MKKIFFAVFSTILIMGACEKDVYWVPDGYTSGTHEAPDGDYMPDLSFKVVAYYSESRVPDSIEMAKFDMITHLNYAFAYPNADGTIQAIAQPARFATMMERAKANGVKTAVSFAGSETVYSAMAADPELRTKFVKNILDFALKNNLDGIDLDWEYPRANKANNITFEALAIELADTLHHWHKFLSAAVTPALYTGGVKDGISQAAIDHIDFFNIMAYDGIDWDSDYREHHSTYRMAETSLNVWLEEKGLPKEKAILGIPAYGKNVDNVAITYRDLLLTWNADPVKDTVTATDGKLYYYNGIDLVKDKALLAKEHANGVMVWELYQDANGENSLLKAIHETVRQ